MRFLFALFFVVTAAPAAQACEVAVPVLNGNKVTFGRLEGVGSYTYSCGLNVSSAIRTYFLSTPLESIPPEVNTVDMRRNYARQFCRSKYAQDVIKSCSR